MPGLKTDLKLSQTPEGTGAQPKREIVQIGKKQKEVFVAVKDRFYRVKDAIGGLLAKNPSIDLHEELKEFEAEAERLNDLTEQTKDKLSGDKDTSAKTTNKSNAAKLSENERARQSQYDQYRNFLRGKRGNEELNPDLFDSEPASNTREINDINLISADIKKQVLDDLLTAVEIKIREATSWRNLTYSVIGRNHSYIDNLTYLGIQIITLPDCDTQIADGTPRDPRLSKIYKLSKECRDRLEEYHAPTECIEGYLGRMQKEVLDRHLVRKRAIVETLSPGHFIAHGGYVVDLEDLVRSGGVMSSTGRLNKGFLQEGQIPRWSLHGHVNSDSTASFWFPWEYKYAGLYSATSGDPKGATDMSIILPSEVAAKYAKAIQIDGSGDAIGEIALTNSPSTIREGKLVNDGIDDLALPLQEAFLVVSNRDLARVKNTLNNLGFTQEWLESHILSLDYVPEGTSENTKNGAFRVVPRNKDKISSWLLQNHPPNNTYVRVEKLEGNAGEEVFKTHVEN